VENASGVNFYGLQPSLGMSHRPEASDSLGQLVVSIERIVITELKEGTFYATIELRQNGSKFSVSSRPSDAIALAVRANTPIFAEEDVLSEASILIKSDEEEREVEKFREFLDQVSPEDFE
jgi:bifunctional DNase/RNase